MRSMNASTVPNPIAPAGQAGSDLLQLMQAMGFKAKTASSLMARASAAIKNRVLLDLAALLRQNLAALQAVPRGELKGGMGEAGSGPLFTLGGGDKQ